MHFGTTARRFILIAGAVTLSGWLSQSAQAADLVPYQATGWRYQVVSPGDPLTTTFYSPSFDDSSWPTGQAAFGTPGCPLDGTLHTAWPVNTNLLLRRSFYADPLVPVVIHFAVDNDANVWVNGNLVTSVTHEGCATLDNFNVVVPPAYVELGLNVIAIQAIDRGVVAYFDLRLEGDAPVPASGRSWGALKLTYR